MAHWHKGDPSKLCCTLGKWKMVNVHTSLRLNLCLWASFLNIMVSLSFYSKLPILTQPNRFLKYSRLSNKRDHHGTVVIFWAKLSRFWHRILKILKNRFFHWNRTYMSSNACPILQRPILTDFTRFSTDFVRFCPTLYIFSV